jgi:Protein of unknown function (DUF3224)
MRRMHTFKRRVALGGGLVAMGVCLGVLARAETPVSPVASQTRSTMATHVSGSFDVQLTPQGPEDKAEGSTLGRMSIDKQFHGDLEATSKGQMLTGVSDVPGSAGYVAMERVGGTLQGRRGSFVLQHTGTMSKSGGYQLSVSVVPDSGSGQLLGLSGKMGIRIVEGKHFYDFEYTLPEPH